jgi:hypothetical protein
MTATIVPTSLALHRYGHTQFFAIDHHISRTAYCRCECSAVYDIRINLDAWAVWAVTHTEPDCPGTGELVHVGRTDGSRTECLTCRRFVDTTPVVGDEVFRTVVAHLPRRTA